VAAGAVVVDGAGRVAAVLPEADLDQRLPADLLVLGDGHGWIGPGVVDAHVHLAFGDPAEALRHGVLGLRDLGAPADRWPAWRSASPPTVRVAGPVVTAPGGYPSRSWGAAGFAAAIHSVQASRALVAELARGGVDLVKVALEPAGNAPVPAPRTLAALVNAAHAASLPVTAHALTPAMVCRALDAGVDELAHIPCQRLPAAVVERVADAGVPVVSTLQTFFAGGQGTDAGRNAADLHAAGVRLVYGTDLGNAGTLPGVDPRELDRLADAGLGRRGALLAATQVAAGLLGRSGRIAVGEPAELVLLAGDPLLEPGLWRLPRAVVSGGRLIRAADSVAPTGGEG